MVETSKRGRQSQSWPVRLVLALVVAAGPAVAAIPVHAQDAQIAGAAAGTVAQYAVIVNGDDSFTHNYNVALAVSSLAQLGYAPRNTLVLAPALAPADAADTADAAAGPAADAAAGPAAAAAATWRRPATARGLRQALSLLHERMRPGDLLLVYLTGHGYRMFGRTSLELQDGSIGARELMQRLAELPFGKLILIADQCYSGGFVNAAVALGRNVVAVASADDRHEARCEPFVRPLWLAILAAENDLDHDGFVSIEEAFQAAAKGLRQMGAGTGGDTPQYAASGSCAGRQNHLSAAGLSVRAAVTLQR
jgi:hypothetical protein